MHKPKTMNLLRGVGRTLDFSMCYAEGLRNKYLRSESRRIDADALRSDWSKVGGDLETALRRFGKADDL